MTSCNWPMIRWKVGSWAAGLMAGAVEPDRPAPLPPPLYLDACATTPLAPEVWQAMEQTWREGWANPSSLHGPGLAAAEALELSRWQVAEDLGASPEEVIWCSGGTEAIQTALLGHAAAQELIEQGADRLMAEIIQRAK